MKVCNGILAVGFAFLALARGGDTDWRRDLSSPVPGNFPALPSVRMHFRFGWSNLIEAARADATIERKGAFYRARVSGGSRGVARAMWSLDADHSAMVNASSFLPVRTGQIERYGKRTIQTQVSFDADGLKRLRKATDSKEPAKWKRVNFTPIFDIIGGVLFVRSQPLRVGDRVGLVCFPGDSPFVAVVRVEKREKVRCMGRDWPALKLSLDIRKLETKKGVPTEAVGYAKFRSGTVWVSDDALRLPLRAEVQVMIGFVYGELSSFDRL